MTEARPQTDGAGPDKARLAWIALLLVGVDLLGLFVYMGRRQYLLSPVWVYLFLYAAAFGFYVYAGARIVPRLSSSRLLVPLIFGFGVLFRLAVLFAPPSLSTDMYRYAWDGRLTLHGINPYHWAPNAGPLRPLRDMDIWVPMEYKAYQTIYMPVSQGVFVLGSALFGNNLTGYKFLYLLFDVGVMALLWRLLRALGRPPSLLVWYAWSPLPITEISLAGHQDVVGVFFLLLAFWLVRRPRTEWGAAVALVAAALTKGFALLLLPLFCRTFGTRFTLIAGIGLVYLGLPMWICLPQFLHGMQQYLDFVNVNSGLFHWLNQGLSPLTKWHFAIATRVSDAAILAVMAWAAWEPAESFPDLLRRSFLVLAVTLLVVPTLFPWYLVWVLPFLTLLGRRPSWAFLLLTGLVALLYTYYISLHAYWWTPVLEYLPFYGALAWEWRRWRQGQRPPVAPVLPRPDPGEPTEKTPAPAPSLLGVRGPS